MAARLTPSCARSGETPRFVDGLRITDAAALDTVVSVLADGTNTMFVAAIGAAGGRAVGPHWRGRPDRVVATRGAASRRYRVKRRIWASSASPRAPTRRCWRPLGIGCIPVVASIGVDAGRRAPERQRRRAGRHLAAILPAQRLIIAGGTAGVLDANGQTIGALGVDEIDTMMASGVAHSGMVAKLAALPSRVFGRRDRYINRGGARSGRITRRRGYPPSYTAGDEGGWQTRDVETKHDDRASNVVALETEHVLQVYKRNPVVFERGRGCYLYDADGRGYLDLISGVGVAALGHANPRLAAAIAEQATTLLHTSNLFFHPLQGELAARLSDLSGLPRAFFCNSGAEAVEACLKFARRYWYAQKDRAAGHSSPSSTRSTAARWARCR